MSRLLDDYVLAPGALGATADGNHFDLEKAAVTLPTPEASYRLAEITQALANLRLVIKLAD